MDIIPKNFKNIPPFFLYQVMMGEGSLYTKGKEIVLILPSFERRLPCGCAGGQAYRFSDKNGNFVYEEVCLKDYSDFTYHIQSFQGNEWDNYWESFYNTNPSRRPIIVHNS